MSPAGAHVYDLPCRHEPVSVALTPEQVEYAFSIGDRVFDRYKKRRKARSRWETTKDRVRQGMAAELAVASYTGLPWNEGDENRADVGNRIEVRHTRVSHHPLRIHPFDRTKATHAFVLAEGEAPYFRLIGWASGARAMSDSWKYGENLHPVIRPFYGGWTVPRHFLWSIALLMAEIDAHREPVVAYDGIYDDVPDGV